MIPVAISLVAVFAFGYFLAGPADRGYSPRAWFVIQTFLKFMFLVTIIVSLILGGAITGQPIAPVDSELAAIAYAAAASLSAGTGAGLRSWRDAPEG